MLKFLKNFRDDESGAVTVDYIVLTAGVVILAILVFGFINNATEGLANDIAAEIEEVGEGFD